jgi:branched-chain amino acid transport system ATP-binding protein
MLKVENLVVKYGSVTAVQGVSLDVAEGEVVGIVGPNGAGKTTTLSAILGLIAPTSGAITFEGRSLLGLSPEEVARMGLALVPEGRRIFGTLTVGENLQLGATVRSRTSDVAEDLERLLDRFGALRVAYSTPADRLSGGQQQQLAIARALLSRPRLLLLDEPSLGLAPLMVDEVFNILQELRASGSTILLVEQNALRTVEFADRCYVLRTGSVTLSGPRETLLNRVDWAAAYLGVPS